MIFLPIISRYLGGCPGVKAVAGFEQKNIQSKLKIFPVVAFSTLAIIAYLLLAKENANVPGVIVAISLCGVIVYYNWKTYRRDGQRPYEPVKLPFRWGEFKSNRERAQIVPTKEYTDLYESVKKELGDTGVPSI